MSFTSSGCSGAVASTPNSTCVVAEGYVQLAECHLLCVHVAGAAAIAALGTYVSTIKVRNLSVEKLPSHLSRVLSLLCKDIIPF